MNWNRIEGNWSELKGQARRNWGKLTEDHIDHVNGKREYLASSVFAIGIFSVLISFFRTASTLISLFKLQQTA